MIFTKHKNKHNGIFSNPAYIKIDVTKKKRLKVGSTLFTKKQEYSFIRMLIIECVLGKQCEKVQQ